MQWSRSHPTSACTPSSTPISASSPAATPTSACTPSSPPTSACTHAAPPLPHHQSFTLSLTHAPGKLMDAPLSSTSTGTEWLSNWSLHDCITILHDSSYMAAVQQPSFGNRHYPLSNSSLLTCGHSVQLLQPGAVIWELHMCFTIHCATMGHRWSLSLVLEGCLHPCSH